MPFRFDLLYQNFMFIALLLLFDMQLIYLLEHPERAVALGTAARATVLQRFTTQTSSTSYELLYRCVRHCGGVADLPCARRCAASVTNSARA